MKSMFSEAIKRLQEREDVARRIYAKSAEDIARVNGRSSYSYTLGRRYDESSACIDELEARRWALEWCEKTVQKIKTSVLS